MTSFFAACSAMIDDMLKICESDRRLSQNFVNFLHLLTQLMQCSEDIDVQKCIKSLSHQCKLLVEDINVVQKGIIIILVKFLIVWYFRCFCSVATTADIESDPSMCQ